MIHEEEFACRWCRKNVMESKVIVVCIIPTIFIKTLKITDFKFN